MSKKKTHELFVHELQDINPTIAVLSQYETATRKIQVKCTVCGNLWDAKPCSLLSGRGCPECGKKNTGNALRKSNDIFVSDLKSINPNIESLGQYTGSRTKIPFRCTICGNEWESTPSDVLSGHGCPKCGYEKQKSAQRHSNEEFIKQLEMVNPNIVAIDEYVNNHTKIRFQCRECQQIWRTVPNSVLLGHGCPSCARSSTSFLEQVILNSFLQAFGEGTVLSRDKELIKMELDIVIPSIKVAYEPGSWSWHYNKIARDLEKRTRCAKIGYRLITIYTDYNKSELPFEKDCYSWETNLGNTNWSETKGFVSALLLEHGLELNDEQWSAVRLSAIESSRRKTIDEYKAELFSINPNIKFLAREYDNPNKMNFECLICGHKWSASPGNVLSGHGCPACGKRRSAELKRKSHDKFVLELSKLNSRVNVIGEYGGSKTKILCACGDCGNRWEATPNNLLKGHTCPKCARLRANNKIRKTHSQFVEELEQKNPNLIIRGQYVDSSTKIEIECSVCKYIWNADPMTVLSGHGCPKCAGSMKKTSEQFQDVLKIKHPTILPLEEYQSANKKIKVRCSICGFEWIIRPHDLLRSEGCPDCRRKKKMVSCR